MGDNNDKPSVEDFLKDVEWDRLWYDELPEPLDEDEPIFQYRDED